MVPANEGMDRLSRHAQAIAAIVLGLNAGAGSSLVQAMARQPRWHQPRSTMDPSELASLQVLASEPLLQQPPPTLNSSVDSEGALASS